MKIAIASLKSVSPLGFSRAIQTPKAKDETHDAHEDRVWKERCHIDDDGNLFIPPNFFKNCMDAAAKRASIPIPGKGTSKFTKHFESGLMCKEPVPLGVHINDVQRLRIFVPSDGKTGGSKRVWKNFPYIKQWEADVEFVILDDLIDKDVFRFVLEEAGKFTGLGFSRPARRGYWGRFAVEDIRWQKV